MTENKAIEFIKERIALIDSNYTDILDYKEALQISVKALEKQIPQKPKTDDRYVIYICPCCNNLIKLCKNYCEYCGQKLDWSEE